ncbi:hypothetical protein C7C46_29740 [Streptomyces tateyamensis]|uniref:Uncharacterized protein n=1 Tax=Streptomyces tateyamensis TaxID=565073 RepID=A0A2V4NI26_9ACTN|nr:hypothetical protein C7C46_29740 [Streptomyces tateyamensis]
MTVDQAARPPARGQVPGPWSVRRAAGRSGRAALEVYEDGELIDVLVASALATGSAGCGVLRGARRGPAGTFAWGRLGPDGAAPVVLVAERRLRPRWAAAGLTLVADEFWLAHLPVAGFAVVARGAGGAVGRLRPSRVG